MSEWTFITLKLVLHWWFSFVGCTSSSLIWRCCLISLICCFILIIRWSLQRKSLFLCISYRVSRSRRWCWWRYRQDRDIDIIKRRSSNRLCYLQTMSICFSLYCSLCDCYFLWFIGGKGISKRSFDSDGIITWLKVKWVWSIFCCLSSWYNCSIFIKKVYCSSFQSELLFWLLPIPIGIIKYHIHDFCS